MSDINANIFYPRSLSARSVFSGHLFYRWVSSSVPSVKLSDVAIMREINDLVLRANELRFTAFTKEQESLRLFDEEVLGIPTSQKKRDTALT
jgi:hypothetical protein